MLGAGYEYCLAPFSMLRLGMDNDITTISRLPTGYAHGYYNMSMFDGIDFCPWQVYTKAMKDIDGMIDLDDAMITSAQNIRNGNKSIDEVIIITLNSEDKIKVYMTPEDDSLSGEMLVDALIAVEPAIELELED